MTRSVFLEQVKQIMASIPGFDIVYDRGDCVLDVDVNVESVSTMKGKNSRATLESVFTWYANSIGNEP